MKSIFHNCYINAIGRDFFAMFSLDVSQIQKEVETFKERRQDSEFRCSDFRELLAGKESRLHCTPFTYACKKKAKDVVHYLLNEPKYEVSNDEYTRGLEYACINQDYDLITYLTANINFTLSGEAFGHICSVVSKDVFDKIVFLLPTTEENVLNAFIFREFDNEIARELISYGCKISEKSYNRIVDYASPETIMLAASKLPSVCVTQTCKILTVRQRYGFNKLEPKQVESLFDTFLPLAPEADYADIIVSFSNLHPYFTVYDKFISFMLKNGNFYNETFGKIMKPLCVMKNSELLNLFVSLYPCDYYTSNHYFECISYCIRELVSTKSRSLQEKLVMLTASVESTHFRSKWFDLTNHTVILEARQAILENV